MSKRKEELEKRVDEALAIVNDAWDEAELAAENRALIPSAGVARIFEELHRVLSGTE